jgi:hypothetical protein
MQSQLDATVVDFAAGLSPSAVDVPQASDIDPSNKVAVIMSNSVATNRVVDDELPNPIFDNPSPLTVEILALSVPTNEQALLAPEGGNPGLPADNTIPIIEPETVAHFVPVKKKATESAVLDVVLASTCPKNAVELPIFDNQSCDPIVDGESGDHWYWAPLRF